MRYNALTGVAMGTTSTELILRGRQMAKEREAKEPQPIAWKSVAWWPETVYLGSVENTSEDTHHSEEAAAAVCSMLRRNGLGGDRKIFPLKTDVQPVFETPGHDRVRNT
jgi:hypothetical protein